MSWHGLPATIFREGGEPLDVLVDLQPAMADDGRRAVIVTRCQNLDGEPMYLSPGARLTVQLDGEKAEVLRLGELD